MMKMYAHQRGAYRVSPFEPRPVNRLNRFDWPNFSLLTPHSGARYERVAVSSVTTSTLGMLRVNTFRQTLSKGVVRVGKSVGFMFRTADRIPTRRVYQAHWQVFAFAAPLSSGTADWIA